MIKRDRNRWLAFIVVTLPALTSCLLLIFAKCVIFPKVLAHLMILRSNEDGSLPLITRLWANTPADIVHSFYLWNVTNQDEVIFEGAIPRLLEHGPYVYVGTEHKENLTWSSDGAEVRYRNRHVWHFSASQSCSECSESMRFIVPSIGYAGNAHIVAKKGMSIISFLLLDAAAMITGARPFQAVAAVDLLFHSYNDPLISLQQSSLNKIALAILGGTLFGTRIPDLPKFAGLMPHHNNTIEPEYRVNTGKASIDDITKIISYGDTTDLNIGKIAGCNEGGINQPFLRPDSKLCIFISYVGRSFSLEFHRKDSFESVPTSVFGINKDEYDTNADKNVGLRYENEEGIDYFPTWTACTAQNASFPNKMNTLCSSTPPGFYPLRVFSGRLDKVPLPAFISPPHMLWAPTNVSSIYTGQHPDELKHQPIEWAINPTLGTLVHARFRAQLNIPIWRGSITLSSNLPNAMVPIFWLDVKVQLHDDSLLLMKLGGHYVPLFFNIGIGFLLTVSVISLSLIAVDKMHQIAFQEEPSKTLEFSI